MKTVAQLQAAGFTVQPSQDATGCTEVVSGQPFWFYNPRFHNDMASIQANLEAARAHGDKFRLVAAGAFEGDTLFPFAVVTDGVKQTLDFTIEEHRQAVEEARKWADIYMATLNPSDIAEVAA
jgi:hypothetical protein